MTETLEDRVRRAVQEDIAIEPYSPEWPRLFLEEKEHLLTCLPHELIGRIEHFGSTAVPGLSAKPIIDMLVEVRALEDVAQHIAPLLREHGYEFFWRDTEPGLPGIAYAWFIKRDAHGRRTHHIHCLEGRSSGWERLLFRDYLRAHPAAAREYDALKRRIAAEHPDDRKAYAKAKTGFIRRVMKAARRGAAHW